MTGTKILAPSGASVTRRQLITGATAAAAFQQLGCASPVPGGNGLSALSGITLQVQLMFLQPVLLNYHYFFLINNSNSSVAPGAVPVGVPISGTTYGNGFATASDSSSGGFTDFVLFSNNQYAGSQPNQGFALYHVASTYPQGVNNSGNFVANGSPFQVFSPQSSGGSPNVIAFNLDLAQLFEYPNSTNNQGAAINLAKSLTWIQVNMVATDVVPITTTTSGGSKHFDSFGDDSNGAGTFLNMNLQDTANTYSPNTSGVLNEPQGDVFVSPGGGVTSEYPQIDLINWTIQIVTTG